jgi:hypothetical protein
MGEQKMPNQNQAGQNPPGKQKRQQDRESASRPGQPQQEQDRETASRQPAPGGNQAPRERAPNPGHDSNPGHDDEAARRQSKQDPLQNRDR